MADWIPAGSIFVDSGSVAVGDPCYTQTGDASSATPTWTEWLHKTWPKEFAGTDGPSVYDDFSYVLGQRGTGIVVSAGYGDGEYPVYIRKNAEGRTAELRVVFIDENLEADEDDTDGYPLS